MRLSSGLIELCSPQISQPFDVRGTVDRNPRKCINLRAICTATITALVFSFTPANAMQIVNLVLAPNPNGSCEPGKRIADLTYTGIPEYDDGAGGDLFAIYFLDGNDTVLDSADVSLPPGRIDLSSNIVIDRNAKSRPFSVVFEDISSPGQVQSIGSKFNRALAMRGASVIFDPVTINPNCAIYPLGPVPEAPVEQDLASVRVTQGFMDARVALLLANAPNLDQRIDRLKGRPSEPALDGSAILDYVSNVVSRGSLPFSASLAATELKDSLPNPLDIWIDGTFAIFDGQSNSGQFSTLSSGADYVLNPNLLVGGFVSIDMLKQSEHRSEALSGLGWMAGPYAIARLSDDLFLDVIAGAGTATNSLNGATGASNFDSSRWMVKADLEGSWSTGPWTFAPRLGVGYAEERSDAFATASGQPVGPVASSVGRITLGPGLIHTYEGEGYRRDLSLRFDTVATLARQQTLGGRLEAGMDFQLDGGAKLGTSTNYSWVGEGTTAVGVSFKVSGGF